MRSGVVRHLYGAIALPAVYRGIQWVLGSVEGRDIVAKEFVRAREGQRMLDIGCGPADILAHLPRVDYTGFDANGAYIEAARKNHGDRGRFYQGMVRDEALRGEPAFDIVLASAILHHLDDQEAEHLFRLAWSALGPGGRLVTIDPVFVDGQNPVARLLVSRDRGEHVRDVQGYVTIGRRVFPEVHATVRGDLMRVPYTHVVLECEKPA